MDVELGRRQYAQGHVPGALFAGIDDDLSGQDRRQRPPSAADRVRLAARFGAWGIDSDTQIVAYDASGGQFAVRLWWLARWLGHAKVALLDGGWPLWLAEAGPSSTEPAGRAPRRFAAGDSLEGVVSAHELQRAARRPQCAAGRRTRARALRGAGGADRPGGRPHPGGSQSLLAGNLADGRSSRRHSCAPSTSSCSPAARRRRCAQCGSGVTACHHLLAMHVAGLSGARLYAGSWSEWIADPSRPVATGAQP